MTTTKQLLRLTSVAILIQGSTAFSSIDASKSSTATPYQGQRETSLESFSGSPARSTLFSGRPRRVNGAQDEPLVNNRYSASDWLHNVFTLPKSSVLKDIRNPVITIALWSTCVSILQRVLERSTSTAFQKMAGNMCIGGSPHSFLVSSLGLLLVFRTNSAYQRFNEGRKIWENILSISRNISRMIHLYDKEIGSDRMRRITNLVAAFPYLLRHHVRPGCLCESDDKTAIPEGDRLLLHQSSQAVVETRYEGDHSTRLLCKSSVSRECWVDKRHFPWSLFEKASLKKVARVQNRPLWVCDRIAREIMSIPYGPNFTSRERLSLIGSIEKLTNTVGQCERIHQTAVPLNYARHSLRSLTLWLVTLPFALVKDMGLLTGPIVAVMSWLLFGVYQIGYSIEDPFQGSLRLSILCDAIRRDVMGETNARDTAFLLEDTWEEEEKEVVVEDKRLKELDDMAQRFTPFFPEATNQADLILNAPTLIKENGTWNVVGMREG